MFAVDLSKLNSLKADDTPRLSAAQLCQQQVSSSTLCVAFITVFLFSRKLKELQRQAARENMKGKVVFVL